MRHSRIEDSDFMGMIAAIIHAGRQDRSVKDSVQTAFDLQNEVEKKCNETRDKIEEALRAKPPQEQPQQRQL